MNHASGFFLCYLVDFCVLLIMIITTAISIIVMPNTRREVSGSLKTSVPMATAVTGSSAPIMAVGVEPMRRTAIAMVTSEMRVGTMPSMSEKPNCVVVVSICKCPHPELKNELITTVMAPKSMTYRVSFTADILSWARLTITIYMA